MLALIIMFENIVGGGQVLILFDTAKTFWGLFFLFGLGFLAGLFIGLAMNAGKTNAPIDDLEL